MKLNSPAGKAHVIDLKNRVQATIQSRIDELGSHPPLQMATKNCILTGGAIVSMFHHETPNDFDLLFNFVSDLDKVKFDIANGTERIINRNLVKNINPNYFHRKADQNSFKDGKAISEWAVTLYNNIQLVLKPITYRQGFDFIHVMPYYDIMRNKLFISPEQFDCLVNKEIKINPKHVQPICEKRVLKYTDRGWSISDEEIKKYSDKKVSDALLDVDPPF